MMPKNWLVLVCLLQMAQVLWDSELHYTAKPTSKETFHYYKRQEMLPRKICFASPKVLCSSHKQTSRMDQVSTMFPKANNNKKQKHTQKELLYNLIKTTQINMATFQT